MSYFSVVHKFSTRKFSIAVSSLLLAGSAAISVAPKAQAAVLYSYIETFELKETLLELKVRRWVLPCRQVF
jgi:hypothetical protein